MINYLSAKLALERAGYVVVERPGDLQVSYNRVIVAELTKSPDGSVSRAQVDSLVSDFDDITAKWRTKP